MASKAGKLHGRVEGAAERCGVRGCREPGEFRAPLLPGDFDGPGAWRWLCLDHVREHNSRYNFFAGMTPDEIEAAQSPIAGWERQTRAFSAAGADPGPAWSDFRDPLDAISARFRPGVARRQMSRFTGEERHALGVLGLREDTDLHAVSSRRPRTPTSMPSAAAIRSWSAATIPTATAATAAMSASSARC
jgi:hypothetical protein